DRLIPGFAALHPGYTGPAALAAVAVLAVLVFRNMLDRHHVFVFSRIEHDDALRRAAGDADVLDRAADQLALVGDQHDLIAVLHGERRHQLAVAVVDAHRDDAFAAAAGGAVLVGRGALAVAVDGDRQYDLLLRRHLDIALGRKLDRGRRLLGFRIGRFLGC